MYFNIDKVRGIHIQAISPIPFEDHPVSPSKTLDASKPTNESRTIGSGDLIVCPEQIMITEPRAREAIQYAQGGPILYQKDSSRSPGGTDLEAKAGDPEDDKILSERQWIASYLVIHLIADDEEDRCLLPQQ